jgi:hypothetical protein
MPTTMPATVATTSETTAVPSAVVPPTVVSGVVVMPSAVVMVTVTVSPSRAAVAIIGTRTILILTKDGPPPAALSVPTHADALFFPRVRLDHTSTSHSTESARQQVVTAFLVRSSRVQTGAAMIVWILFGH